ncbi:MAG TPA: hypothetical protein VFT95_00660, partial [Micromonosporaceae bacterium]|nr:hypothetical protein [Micromonosporaceae bacterium]
MAGAVTAVVLVAVPGAGGAAAAEPAQAAPAGDVPVAGEHQSGVGHASLDKDYRTGRVTPDARQRGRVASGTRFNALGTPSALGPG